MKNLICIVCFFLGYFIADVVSKCGFGKEHYTVGQTRRNSNLQLRSENNED